MATAPQSVAQDRFGKYVITAQLGRGGMAEVFLCRLPGIGGFDKTVVVKRILPDLIEDSNFLDMFLDEARVAANLTHPNVAQVFEIDHVDQVPYIAMEYVRGPSLSRLLKEARKTKSLHLGHFAKIISGAAEGLHYAHNAKDPQGNALQIVHRDVTPQNILVSLDGVTKMVDFGVARARGRLAVTQEGMIKGKLRYMSPEQTKSKEYDFRADVFSLGVCLYYGAVGRHPFDGDSEIEVMKAIMTGDYPAPSTLVPDFPPKLEEIIAGALEPDPAKRTPNANELHLQLEDLVREGALQSNVKAVAAWANGLFPDFDARPSAYGSYTGTVSGPSVPGSGPVSHPGGTPVSNQYRGLTPSGARAAAPDPDTIPLTYEETRPPWKALVFGGVGALLAIGIVVAVYTMGRNSSAPAAPVATVAPTMPTPPPPVAAAAPTPTPASPPAVASPSTLPTAAPPPPVAVQKPAWGNRPSAPAWKPPAAGKPTPAAAQPPTQPSPAAPTPNPTWTPDSPLPPQ